MRSWIAGLVVLAALMLAACSDKDVRLLNPADSPYAPLIDPADFSASTTIDNPFFPLPVGRTWIYEGGDEHIEVEVTDQTRIVMGISCVVVRDRVWEDDELVEDTCDWYAQDDDGNVWYMGEETEELEGGVVVSTAGSWEAGVDGALPGIIMLARPLAGLWYRTEYYQGEAEDLAQVLGLNETVTVPAGTYTGCVRILDFSALEPDVAEHKTYAPGVGLVKEVVVRGGSGSIELISVGSGT